MYLIGSQEVQASVLGLSNRLNLCLVTTLAGLANHSLVYDQLVHYVVGVLEEDVVS